MNGKVVQFLSQAALGPVYGLYSINTQAPELNDPAVHALQHSRYGMNMNDILGPSDTALLHIPMIPISSNSDTWLNYIGAVGSTPEKKKLAIQVRQLRQSCATIILKKVFGTKVVDNSFQQLSYGSNPDGIHASTTADILHVLKNGIFPKLTETIFNPMSPSQLSAIDYHVEHLFGNGINRSSARSAFPRVSFLKGYTKLTELRGYERVGQLYVLAVLLRTNKGRNLLSPRLAPDFEKRKHSFHHRSTSNTKQSSFQIPSYPNDSTSPSDDTSISDGATKLPIFCGHPSIWTIDQCLSYLRLETLKSLIESNCLPSVSHENLKSNLNTFFTPRTIKILKKSSELNGELPGATFLGYRPIPEITVADMQRHRAHADIKITRFPKSQINFQCDPKRSENSVRLDLDQLSYVVETSLTVLGYCEYASKHHLLPEKIMQASKSLELMRRVIVLGIERKESTFGWSFQKFIEMYHILMETPEFGRGGGKDTSDQESHMKGWAVKPAKTSQKREDNIFTEQLCLRYGEAGLLSKICQSNSIGLLQRNEGNLQPEVVGRGRHEVSFLGDGTVKLNHRFNRGILLDPVVTDYFGDKLDVQRLDSTSDSRSLIVKVLFFTEVTLPNGTLIRSHSNYKGEGCWYDCVKTFDTNNIPPLPMKIVAIYHEGSEFDVTESKSLLPTHVLAVISHPQSKKEYQNNSQLFRHRRWQSMYNERSGSYVPIVHSFSLNEVREVVFCIDIFPNRGGLVRQHEEHFMMLEATDPKTEWSDFFLDSEQQLGKKMK
jgi:hypothetical protein